MEHTKTPWIQGSHSSISAIDPPYLVARAICTHSDHDLGRANAAFIVQAVNSYEPMREALEQVLAACEDYCCEADSPAEFILKVIAHQVKAALKPAKEEPNVL